MVPSKAKPAMAAINSLGNAVSKPVTAALLNMGLVVAGQAQDLGRIAERGVEGHGRFGCARRAGLDGVGQRAVGGSQAGSALLDQPPLG